MSGTCLSAGPESAETFLSNASVETAPVIIDHQPIFSVRGITAFPAEERARLVTDRIKEIASDPAIPATTVSIEETDSSTNLVAGKKLIMRIFDADGVLEGITRQLLAEVYVKKVQDAILAYRTARTPENIIRGVVYSVIATIILITAIFMVLKLFRKWITRIESTSKEKFKTLDTTLSGILGAEGIWALIEDIIKTVRTIIVIVLIYIYLHEVLSFFPWSRRFALTLLDYIINPLKIIGFGILKEVPDLIFIVVLIFIVRLILKFIHLFFRQIEWGTRRITGFYPEWAKPTDRIVTFCIVVFAAVIAFPYVPGSNTGAFKGISIFIGVLFSIGSQSTIANTIAGFVVLYRRAFRVGDRIKVIDVIGDVTAVRMQVTQLRTIKNEEIIIPNSSILNSPIINYSSMAREKGLILHTEVTIGYDAPWRQVQELLLMAADRTNGVMKEPAPFVHQKSLDDFYVRYELNTYTDAPQMMANIYSELHRRIQDCFNEYGVQIMSPHYLGDPAEAKVVPKDDWYKSPASQPAEGDKKG
jgi:small-conductance mechanosensitive channel